jgi:hypothetical protein
VAPPRRKGQPSGLEGKAVEALREFDELNTAHRQFLTRYERNVDAYKGKITERSKASEHTHQLAPPYAEHIIETTVASMLDEQLRFKITPAHRLYQSPDELELAEKGAKAHQILLRMQMKLDRFDEKPRPWVLQERLAGMSPAKVYWRQSAKKRKRLVDTGFAGIPHLEVTEQAETVYDGPCVEVCDMTDFFWDDQAVSLDACGVVCHRTWPTFEECKRMQRLGYWENVDQLPATRDFSADLDERDRKWIDQKRGRIEVLEIWRREESGAMRVYTVANRTVLLREMDNPFWHGEFPFVLFVGQPLPFRILGRAQVEKIAALQEALWSIANQRLDNLMYLNNAIQMFNEDLIDDLDGQEWYPGARWVSQGPPDQAFQMWTPNPVPAQISIPAEGMVKADMQNLAGGFPFTSTSEAQTVNASTATEASLVASLAQRSIIGAKRQLYDGYRRIGQMMLELNQQFVREPVYSLVIGANDSYEQMEIVPQMLQGEYLFDIEPMTESLMRQERRSEGLSLFQALAPAALQAAPALAAQGVLFNMQKIFNTALESYDHEETDSWWLPMPQQAAPPGGMPGMGTPPSPDQGPGGVTNPSLAAGPQAVSNGNSMAPASMMQQFLADQTPSNA